MYRLTIFCSRVNDRQALFIFESFLLSPLTHCTRNTLYIEYTNKLTQASTYEPGARCLYYLWVVHAGVGGGLTIVCCYHSTALYFDKRLGLANGIMVTGGSLGLILMPQLASFLQERYPFRWASFLTGELA